MSMDIEQFENELDRFGADFDAWPESLRREAERLQASDERAVELVAATRLMTTTLDDLTVPAPSPTLGRRILDQAFEETTKRESAPSMVDQVIDWLTGAFWRPVSLAFVPLILGFTIGLNVQEDVTDFESEVTILAFTGAEFFDETLDE